MSADASAAFSPTRRFDQNRYLYPNLLETMSLLNGKLRILTLHAKDVSIKIFHEVATLGYMYVVLTIVMIYSS